MTTTIPQPKTIPFLGNAADIDSEGELTFILGFHSDIILNGFLRQYHFDLSASSHVSLEKFTTFNSVSNILRYSRILIVCPQLEEVS